jgi:imidazolonepropionase-like amidohydrolase
MTILPKFMLLKALVAVVFLTSLHSYSIAESSYQMAFIGGVLFDGTGQSPVKDSVILVRDNRITEVGKRGEVNIPKSAQVINVHGKWIIPGLIDSHVHFFQSAGLFTRPDILDLRDQKAYPLELSQIRERIPNTLSRYICSGVTSVVDMGGPFWTVNLKHEVSQLKKAPRLTAAGPLISTSIPSELRVEDPPNLDLGTPEEARATVRTLLKQGADMIKVWFISSGNPVDFLPSIRAAIDEAHKNKIRVAVHATELALARYSVEAGADILVHSVADRLVDPDFIQLLKKRNVIYIPTLMVKEGYQEVLSGNPKLNTIEKTCGDPEIIATWEKLPSSKKYFRSKEDDLARENLKRLSEAGVVIASGSDAGNIGTLHGPAIHREVELMVEAGLSPQKVLLSATRDAAKVISVKPEVGTLEPGKLADFIVLKENPLADIRNLSKIEKVIKGGRPT